MSQYKTLSSSYLKNAVEYFSLYNSNYNKYYDLDNFIKDKITSDNINEYIAKNTNSLQTFLNKYDNIISDSNTPLQNAELVLQHLTKQEDSNLVSLVNRINEINFLLVQNRNIIQTLPPNIITQKNDILKQINLLETQRTNLLNSPNPDQLSLQNLSSQIDTLNKQLLPLQNTQTDIQKLRNSLITEKSQLIQKIKQIKFNLDDDAKNIFSLYNTLTHLYKWKKVNQDFRGKTIQITPRIRPKYANLKKNIFGDIPTRPYL